MHGNATNCIEPLFSNSEIESCCFCFNEDKFPAKDGFTDKIGATDVIEDKRGFD